MGACVIEKHLTLDRTMIGPDHASSLVPAQFGDMVMSIRNVEQALGTGRKSPMPSEMGTKEIARKSLVAAREIHKGEIIMPEMVNIQRPGTGVGVEQLYGG
jgi:sialic acid synthase SpsE